MEKRHACSVIQVCYLLTSVSLTMERPLVDSTDYGRELLTNESGDRYVFKDSITAKGADHSSLHARWLSVHPC